MTAATTLRILPQRQRHVVVHQSYAVRCFPRALGFGQSNNSFYEIYAFFKNQMASENSIFYIFPLKSFNLVLAPGIKLEGRQGTWT